MPHPEFLKFTPVIGAALCGSGIYGLINPLHGKTDHNYHKKYFILVDRV
jgi:hypothetical protein